MIPTSLPDEMSRLTILTPMSYAIRRTTDDSTETDDHPVAPFSLPEDGDLVEWLETTRLERLEDYSKQRRGNGYTTTDYGYLPIHDEYDLVTSSWYDSQQQVADAWSRMEYPRRNADSSGSTRLQCTANFEGIQHADGSGVLMHYRTTEAWRTRSLLTINNADCWSRGFAHCTPPGGFRSTENSPDVTLSRQLLERLLREGPTDDDVAGLVSHYEHDQPDGSTLRVLSLESEGVLAFWTDPTANDPRCAVVFEPERALLHAENDYATILNELKPREVRAVEDSIPVRDADTLGDDPEIPGGYTLRQGEWFFIPCDPDFEPDNVFEPHDNTVEHFFGNHEPRDFGVDDSANSPNIYARGWVSHPRDHERAYLGERWHYACESPVDSVRVLEQPETRSRTSQTSSRSRTGMRYD